MLISSEAEMQKFGADFAKSLTAPTTIELIGDLGAGKTTFVRGLALGLGIDEPISSPSFTISRSYQGKKYTLNHYDFYRLSDPGLMADDFRESTTDENTITVVEWGDSLSDFLPENRKTITIATLADDKRELTIK